MEKVVMVQILFCSLFIFLVMHFSPATSQEVEDERAFDYEAWSTRGPARWRQIHPKWRMCNNGTMQSPIDLLDQRLRWTSGEAGYIDMNGTQYLLQQLHWHTPSKHTINGRRFDLELHMVHQSRTGQIVVIGITYRFGSPDFFSSSMESHLQDMANMTCASQPQKLVGIVDLRRLSIRSRSYYRYIGSLTVPPCTQNVVWIVLQEMRPVAREQVRLLRMTVRDGSATNARPLQQKHGRSVQLCNDQVNDQDQNPNVRVPASCQLNQEKQAIMLILEIASIKSLKNFCICCPRLSSNILCSAVVVFVLKMYWTFVPWDYILSYHK